METSSLNFAKLEGTAIAKEYVSDPNVLKQNPKNREGLVGKNMTLSDKELSICREALADDKALKAIKPTGQFSEDYSILGYSSEGKEKKITSIQEVQMILSVLTVELVFFHFLKLNNDLLSQVRKNSQKNESFEKAIDRFNVLKIVGEVRLNVDEEASVLATAIHYRFKNRNFTAGLFPGDTELLNYAIEKGTLKEKDAARELLKRLNDNNNNKILDVYADHIIDLTEGIATYIKKVPLFHAFYCSSHFRFKLLHLSLDERIEKLNTVLAANNAAHYFAYIQSNLDAIIEEKRQLLSSLEEHWRSLLSIYKKVHALGKDLVHGSIVRYKECFTRCVFPDHNSFFSLGFSNALDSPDIFEKRIHALFLQTVPPVPLKEECLEKASATKEIKKAQAKKKKKSTKGSKSTRKEKGLADSGKEIETKEAFADPLKALKQSFPYQYAARVTRWWGETIPQEYQNLSEGEKYLEHTFHAFSVLVDQFVLSYGVKAKWPNKTTHAEDPIYLLPGTVYFEQTHKTFRGIFTYCIGKERNIYHRYFSRNLEIYAIPEIDTSFRFFDFPSLEQVISLDSRSADQQIVKSVPEGNKESLLYDPILKTIQIVDEINQVRITLFWTPEKGSEMVLLNPISHGPE